MALAVVVVGSGVAVVEVAGNKLCIISHHLHRIANERTNKRNVLGRIVRVFHLSLSQLSDGFACFSNVCRSKLPIIVPSASARIKNIKKFFGK